MTEDEAPPVYEPGDVVYGNDPFKGAGAARPWLIVSNHEGRPFHGDQYIAVTLTTRSWPEGLIAVPESAWIEGGAPDESRIVPWGVQSLDRTDVDHWQGRLEPTLLEEAVDALVDCLRSAVQSEDGTIE